MQRNTIQLEEDRLEISDLMARGHNSPKKIADIINRDRSGDSFLSVAMVLADMKAINQRHIEKQVENVGMWKSKLLEMYLSAAQRADESFELSKTNKVRIIYSEQMDEEVLAETATNLSGRDLRERGRMLNAKIEEESRQEGNPAFMAEFSKNLDKIAKLVIPDSPTKVALTDSSGEDSPSPLLEIMDKLKNLSNNDVKQLPAQTDNEDVQETV